MAVPDDELIRQIISSREEAEHGRDLRMRLNRQNRAVYDGRQDFDDKIEGQSKEFIPLTMNAVEQFSAFIRRSVTQQGSYFQVTLPDQTPVSGFTAQKILEFFLDHLPQMSGNDEQKFSTVLTEGVKVALLESVMIFKVYGGFLPDNRRVPREEGQKPAEERNVFRLFVDLVRPEDYYPDPSGHGGYEIHEVERDLWYLVEMAERGLYDLSEVKKITEDYGRSEPKMYDRDLEQLGSVRLQEARRRKKVLVTEFWGVLLDEEGRKIGKSRVCVTLANERHVIRKPDQVQWWHGETPFVVVPLIRVPFSVWHKAIWDFATPLNEAYNELFNLSLDGGIAAVWGTRQVRLDWLVNPEDVSQGIPQAETLAVNSSCPPGGKAVEVVAEGQVPGEAMALLELLEQRFQATVFTNDIRMGQLPPKQITATEVAESVQSAAVVMDSIALDIEAGIEKILRKCWYILLQYMDSVEVKTLANLMQLQELMNLTRMSPVERFYTLADPAVFKVSGISSALIRSKGLQRVLGLLQVVTQNPILANVFYRKYSAEKILNQLFKNILLDPRDFEPTPEEALAQQASIQEAQAAAAGGAAPGGIPPEIPVGPLPEEGSDTLNV